MIIGIGNDYRGDDGAGLEAARALGGLENGGDPAELVEAWTGADLAVVIDCAHAHDPPGTIRCHAGLGLPPAGHTSTHGLSLADALDLGRALGRLPRRLVVVTVEGAGFELGAPLSPAVRQALPELISRCAEVARPPACPRSGGSRRGSA
ncbi:hypothetical protein GCM10022248_01600 [Nonomuraea soli]